MRILHFLDTLNRGGAETQVLDVCRNARDFGFEMTFVAAGGGALEEDFRSSGAEFIRLNRRFSVDLYLASQLRKIIKEREIKIVQCYQAVEGLHLYLATRGLKTVKKVLSFQGFIQDAKNRRTAKFLIPRMDANLVVSNGLKQWLETEAKLDTNRNFTVLYNGADRKRIASDQPTLRKELNMIEHDLLFGMIANFYRDPRKDQLTVCRSLPEVFKQIKNAHCVFVGAVEPGAERNFNDCVEFCRSHKITDRVHFLGARSDVPDILAALDLFVLSSLHEGLPLAVSEAMLAGVPMILSDIEPLLEVSRGGACAEIFPVKNAEVLSEKILQLLSDAGARKNLADCALEFARENFSIEAHLRGLRRLYESLLDK